MRKSFVWLSAILGILAIGAAASAQTADHLKCYKMKDPLNVGGRVDLNTALFGVDPGCKIAKAKFFCVPSTKTNIAVIDKKSGQGITPLPVAGPDPGDRICYKVTCRADADNVDATDQFGARRLTKLKAAMVCTPAIGPTTTTTTTTLPCVPNVTDGASCTQNCECVSGVCATYFADSDGDAFGAGSAVQLCGGSAPSGFSANSSDCCDTDANAKPSQTTYFTSQTACGGYDYNCDGVETQKEPTPVPPGTQACFGSPPCFGAQTGFVSPVPACGQNGAYQTCNTANCSTFFATVTQSCR